MIGIAAAVGPFTLSRVAAGDGGNAWTAAVSLSEAKRHCNVYHDQDDTLIEALIAAAQASLEGHDGTGGTIGRAVSRHRLALTCGTFPASRLFPLAQPDVIAVADVTYTDVTGVARTFSSGSYRLIPDAHRPALWLVDGASWPSTIAAPDAVRIRYDVGPATCPADIKAAILLHVGHLYVNREAAGESVTPLPLAYKHLLDPHRTHGWI